MRTPALLSMAILLLPTLALAQGGQSHEGFYLSGSLSPASGDINQSVSNGPYSHATFSGTGVQLDLRVGAALSRNNILSFDISSRAIVSPTADADGATLPMDNNASIGDAILGVGFTHYFVPANAFVSLTLGTGSFTITNYNRSGSTDRGFGYILRAGKEWYVARHLGMGVVGGVAHLSANDKSDPNYPGYAATFTTTQFFVGFSTTFN